MDHLKAMDESIRNLRREAEKLLKLADQEDLEAVRRNAKRILASVRMLELEVSDPLEVLD
ncbi:MAG: hypothetical protein DRG31_01165 [Deltaproteobacteria bacterium]|nr:MAG: hypothetical protein DRG31_01165 [Deltaproteobacteria bacterium]